ncbi:trypsin eta-like [Cochliomyia hominivorax]
MINKLKIVNKIIFCIILIISCVRINGNAQPAKEGKIVGGSAISIYEARYQISLRVKSREKSRGFGRGHICGGSVIGQRLLLTAAHCVQNYVASDFTVVMGNANQLKKDPLQLQYNVQQIIKHKDYNSTIFTNDIALLFINGYIPWDWPTVKAIPLNRNSTPVGSLCKISGWGDMGNGQLSVNLRGASVPIISYAQCQASYGYIPHTMICAGYISLGDIDACQGDSGGPFVCNNLLTGVVSWGEGCALAYRPGVYTNVSAYYDWIVKENSTLNYTLYTNNSKSLVLIYNNLNIVLVLSLLYLLK